MVDALPAPDSVQNLGFFGVAFWRDDEGDVLTDGFFSVVAKDSFRTFIPARDDTIEVLADDGVVGGGYDGSQQTRDFFCLLRLAHILWRTIQQAWSCGKRAQSPIKVLVIVATLPRNAKYSKPCRRRQGRWSDWRSDRDYPGLAPRTCGSRNSQATVYNPIHENFIERHRQIPGLEAVRPAQSLALLSRLRHVLLHDRRAVRPRRHGYDLRPRDHADLSSRPSIFLVHSSVAGFGRTDHRHARRGRLLSLDARCLR